MWHIDKFVAHLRKKWATNYFVAHRWVTNLIATHRVCKNG